MLRAPGCTTTRAVTPEDTGRTGQPEARCREKMVGFCSFSDGGRTALVSRRCYKFVWAIVLLQSGVAGIGLPEHASGGHVGQSRLGKHAQDVDFGNCSSRRCSADDGTGPATLKVEPEWGEIEQKCDLDFRLVIR